MRSLIKKLLHESVGVPEGILETAENLYDMSLKKLKKFDPFTEEKIFKLKTDFKISDYEIKKINLTFNFTKTDQVEEVVIPSMVYQGRSRLSDDLKIEMLSGDEIWLKIHFAGPEETKTDDLVNFFKKDKVSITSNLSHELKHSYDVYKKKYESIKSQSKYFGYQRTSFPFKPINDFLHYLYFIHNIENLVRPTEVASRMRSGNIDKEGFYDFITNDRTYQMLKRINQFTYEGLRNELKSDIKNINSFFKKMKHKFSGTDDEKVDELLRIVYVNLVNNSLIGVKSMLTTHILNEILGFQGGKDEMFNKMIDFFRKFDNDVKKFYLYEEKNFKRISTIMMKKIISVYTLAKENKSSIKDWELHHKINKTGEQFETEIKFKSKKK